MSIISEALEEALNEVENRIKIEVLVEPILIENLMSGNKVDIYDDQTLSEWYDFVDNVEGIVDNFGIVKSVLQSKHSSSLSEHIDFYPFNQNGEDKDYVIDLRISEHKITTGVRRKKETQYSKWKLVSVTVNSKAFGLYDEALTEVEKVLTTELK